jgi:hypothetical protein
MYKHLQERYAPRPPVNVATLMKMKAEGEKIACITAYDSSFATLVDDAGIDLVLVGDSLGMVIQGHDTTVPVTLQDIIYHCRAVARGLYRPFLMADMPFMTYHSREQALDNAVLAGADGLNDAEALQLVRLIAAACGSRGMTGGQSIDLASEGQLLTREELEHMHFLKTGALLRAAVMSAACLRPDLPRARYEALDCFAHSIGLAFQIRDDILDIEGETRLIGKSVGADQRLAKATWPALFGLAESKQRCGDLLQQGLASLDDFGDEAELLRQLARYIVERAQ